MNSFSIRNGAPSLSCPPRLPALRTRRRRTGRSSAARTRSCRWRRCRQPATARSSRPAGPDGGSRWGFWTSQAPDDGWWTRQPNGTLQRFMALGVTGTTGPGRVGVESGHTFAQRFDDAYDGGIDGKRAFLARAGAANAYTDGAWLWDGVRNIEIARSPATPAIFRRTGAARHSRASSGNRSTPRVATSHSARS